MQKILSVRFMRGPDGQTTAIITTLDENRQYSGGMVAPIVPGDAKVTLKNLHTLVENHPAPMAVYPAIEPDQTLPF